MENLNEKFIFAAVGLAHGHIVQMCEGLIAAGAELKYVYDADTRAVDEFLKSFPGAKRASGLREILSDNSVKLVASADIPYKRAPLGVKVIKAGKHYFSAKAPAVNMGQLNRLRFASLQAGKKFFVYYSEYVASEAALYANALIEKGKIGKVLNVTVLAPHKLGNRPDWFYSKRATGGILIDIGSHQFEQFLRYTGNKRARVQSANVKSVPCGNGASFESFGDVHLIGENGATGYIRVDWFTPEYLPVFGDGKVVILGTDGYIELRKYIDIGTGDATETVVSVLDGKAEKFSVKNKVEKPYFKNIISDCINGTDTAMDPEHAFYTMKLAITAQMRADRKNK